MSLSTGPHRPPTSNPGSSTAINPKRTTEMSAVMIAMTRPRRGMNGASFIAGTH